MTPAGVHSVLASYRYRMLIPLGVLKQRGHEVKIIAQNPDTGRLDSAIEQLRGADAVIFAKNDLWNVNESLLAAARQLNVATVADFCDDYFGNRDRRGEHYLVMAMRADAISVSTPFLARRIAEETSREATVIVDPYEGPRGVAKWAPGRQLRALWFGHHVNFPGLQKSLDVILSAGIPMHLVVMTMNRPDIVQWCGANSAPARDCAVEFREWSLEAMWRALHDCDVVLLPIDRAHPYYLSKGHIRVVESLWAGRFVIANSVPAYENFGAWAWIGDDIAAGLRWSVEHPSEVVARINQAQKHILATFSPQTIAKSWEKFLKSVRRGRRSSAASREP